MQRENAINRELLKSLPLDRNIDPDGVRLVRFFAGISDKKVPVSSLSRIYYQLHWFMSDPHPDRPLSAQLLQ
jgi:hypothetical protein